MPNTINLSSELRLGHEFGKGTRKEEKLHVPKRLRDSKEKVEVVYRYWIQYRHWWCAISFDTICHKRKQYSVCKNNARTIQKIDERVKKTGHS